MPLGSSSAAPVITPGPRTFSAFLIQEYALRSTDLCSFPKEACPGVGLVSADASASEPPEFWEVLIRYLHSQGATQMDARNLKWSTPWTVAITCPYLNLGDAFLVEPVSDVRKDSGKENQPSRVIHGTESSGSDRTHTGEWSGAKPPLPRWRPASQQ
jgi:hypothetical protein